jgi:hypothetical protein
LPPYSSLNVATHGSHGVRIRLHIKPSIYLLGTPHSWPHIAPQSRPVFPQIFTDNLNLIASSFTAIRRKEKFGAQPEFSIIHVPVYRRHIYTTCKSSSIPRPLPKTCRSLQTHFKKAIYSKKGSHFFLPSTSGIECSEALGWY